jgi:hypothetical protein
MRSVVFLVIGFFLSSTAGQTSDQPNIRISNVRKDPVVLKEQYKLFAEPLVSRMEMILSSNFQAPTPELKHDLEIAEKGLTQLFNDKWDSVTGARIFTWRDEGDVLLIRCKASAEGIGDIFLWDGAKVNWFVVEIKDVEQNFDSYLKRLIKDLFKPGKLLQLSFERFLDVNDGLTGFGHLVHSGLPASPREGEWIGVSTVRLQDKSFLVFSIGKRVVRKAYDEDSVWIPERFPPLRERISGVPKSELIVQLGTSPERDAILLDELIRRELSHDEFESLLNELLNKQSQSTNWFSREDESIVALFARKIRASGKATEYEPSIEKILSSGNKISQLFPIIRITDKDYSDQVLLLLEKGQVQEDRALFYLGQKVNDIELLKRLETLKVSQGAEGIKYRAISEIRQRLRLPDPNVQKEE